MGILKIQRIQSYGIQTVFLATFIAKKKKSVLRKFNKKPTKFIKTVVINNMQALLTSGS